MAKIKRVYRSKEERRKIIGKYRKSGLSVHAYSMKSGISQSNIARWCNQFPEGQKPPPSLIELKPALVQGQASKRICEIELEITEGILLRIRSA